MLQLHPKYRRAIGARLYHIPVLYVYIISHTLLLFPFGKFDVLYKVSILCQKQNFNKQSIFKNQNKSLIIILIIYYKELHYLNLFLLTEDRARCDCPTNSTNER